MVILMLGKHTVSNIKMIAKGKPSLYVKLGKEHITISLYMNCSDKTESITINENQRVSVIGSITALNTNESIGGKNAYRILGTVGAYPGFGSLMYEALLYELNTMSESAVLISDRESVRGEAENIYHKMNEYDGIDTFKIPVNHSLYSHDLQIDVFDIILENSNLDEDMDYDEFIERVESGEISPYVLNMAYAYNGSSIDTQKYLNILKLNHQSRNLSTKVLNEIESESAYLGDYVDCNRNELIDLRDRNFEDYIYDINTSNEKALEF